MPNGIKHVLYMDSNYLNKSNRNRNRPPNFQKTFAISMLKKLKKFCRRGLTYLDATPFFEKWFRYIGLTLYKNHGCE